MRRRGFIGMLGLGPLLPLVPRQAPAQSQGDTWHVGLSLQRTLIRAIGLRASDPSAPTVLCLAGLTGESVSSDRTRTLYDAYAGLAPTQRRFHLMVLSQANPDGEALAFPPPGEAYRQNPVSHALWRWLGVHAPDRILIVGPDPAGLAEALQRESVAGIGSIPAQSMADADITLAHLQGLAVTDSSAAAQEIRHRRQRSPIQLAQQLALTYGRDFSTAVYVPGMSIIGRMRLEGAAAVASRVMPHLSESPPAIDNPSAYAGRLVFAEYAERTGDGAALALARAAADLGFDEQGNLREAVPFHNEMSDSVFMAPPLLAKVGKLTGEARYFDMAARHITFMQNLLLRADGLYRHSPLADVAWSRGNGFPALGLTLVLTDLPESHPAYGVIHQSYLRLLGALLPYQDTDGLWREVIDYPGAFAELTSTAMIGIALKRGIDRRWLDTATCGPALDRAWQAVLTRTSPSGAFVDACASTGKFDSLDAYLDRPAILGPDDRSGGMVMNFALEMAGRP